MPHPTFFVKRGDRLIARLKHLFYAWRFADQVNGKVVIIWPPVPSFWHQYDGTDYSPSRIFNLREFYENDGSDSLVFLEGPISYPKERRSLRDSEFAAMRPNGFDRNYFIDNKLTFHEQDAIVFSFKDEPKTREYMDGSVRRLYNRLPHDPVFARTLQAAKERIGSSDYVGLHVRRGDVDEMLRVDLPKLADNSLPPDRLALLIGHYVGRTALNEFYYADIENALRSGRKIVYFSDSPETLNHFAEVFGRANFVNAELFRARLPIQKAFLDFNLLIGASTIISTGTNYATFAATLGKAEIVNVAGAGEPDRLEQHLYDQYLGGITLTADASRMLRNEIERQCSRRTRLRPLAADEELVPTAT